MDSWPRVTRRIPCCGAGRRGGCAQASWCRGAATLHLPALLVCALQAAKELQPPAKATLLYRCHHCQGEGPAPRAASAAERTWHRHRAWPPWSRRKRLKSAACASGRGRACAHTNVASATADAIHGNTRSMQTASQGECVRRAKRCHAVRWGHPAKRCVAVGAGRGWEEVAGEVVKASSM